MYVELAFGQPLPLHVDRSFLYMSLLTISIAQVKAEARKQARVVASKLKKHGLASLSTEDIAVIFKQVY